VVFVMTIESELESAQKLGYPASDTADHNQDEVIIRWGNSELIGGKDFKRVINTSRAIVLNCHKVNSLRRLAQVVKVPELYTRRAETKDLILLRPITHTGGESFKVVKGPVEIERGFYGTSWIKTKLEYRVWFAWNRTLCAERIRISKEEDDDLDYTTDTRVKPDKYPCRSSWGYRFLDRTPRSLHRDTINAAKKIGLSMGAADVLGKDGEHIFLELNSAPSVDHRKIRVFFQDSINAFVARSDTRRGKKNGQPKA
jgi:hypothetical protein